MGKRSAQHPEIALLVVHPADAGGAALHHVGPDREALFGEPFAIATGAELGKYLDAGHPGVVGDEVEGQTLPMRHLTALAWARGAAYRPFTEWFTTEPGHPEGNGCRGVDFLMVADADRLAAEIERGDVGLTALILPFGDSRMPALLIGLEGSPEIISSLPLAEDLDGLIEWVPNPDSGDGPPPGDLLLREVGVESVVLAVAEKVLARNDYQVLGEWEEIDGLLSARIRRRKPAGGRS